MNLNTETTWTVAHGIGVILLAFAAGGMCWWAASSAWHAAMLSWDESERGEERRLREEDGTPQ